MSWAQAWLRGQTSLGCASTTQRQFPTPKKFECGLGQPPRPHRYVDSCFAFVTAERRNDRFSPTAFRRNAAFAKASCNPRSCDHERQPLRWPAGPLLFQERGRRPQRPGNQSRIRVSGNPPAIHPRESPAAAGSAAIIRQTQDSHVFAALTFRQNLAARNTKKICACAEPVDVRPSLWKNEEN